MHRIAMAALVALVAGCTGKAGNGESEGGAAATVSPARGAYGGATTAPSGAVGPGGVMGHDGMMGGGRMGAMMGGQADTAAAPEARAAAARAPGCPPVSQAAVNQGRSIFTGTGNCYTCHGNNAQGTALAPSLTDSQWLDTDGSYGGIAGVVRDGVPHPKQHPAPMPAKGGATLDAGQVCAVAAYVYSVSHARR